MSAKVSSARQFLTQFNHFFFGSTASMLLGFISFPILTRLLTKEQYGIVGLVSTTLTFALCFAKLGLSDGIIRLYEEYRHSEPLRAVFSSTVFFQGLSLALATTLVYLALLSPFFSVFGIDPANYSGFVIMAGCLFVRPFGAVAANLMRVEGRTLSLNLIGLVGKMLSVALSLGLLLYLSRSLNGYFVGQVLAEAAVTMAMFWWFFRNFAVRYQDISGNLTKKLIVFGAPMMLNELSYNVLSYGDRYVIVSLSGTEALGIYTVGYNLAMYLANIIVFPLSYTIVPIYVKIYHQEGLARTRDFLNGCLYYFLIALVPVCAGFYALAPDLFVLLASSKYDAAAVFAPVILVANLLLGMNSIFNAGLYLQKKSGVLMGIMLAASAVNLLANFMLIPLMGLFGAALSTLLGCLLSMLLTIALSHKHLSFSLDVGKLAYHLLLSGVMVYVLSLITMREPARAIVVKMTVGFAIVAIGFLAKEREFLTFLRDFRKNA